jgi:hypothetical protein
LTLIIQAFSAGRAAWRLTPLANIDALYHNVEHPLTADYPSLVRAADLIGQLADPQPKQKFYRYYIDII